MAKELLTLKKAQEIQDEILYNMPSDKSIKLTARLFMLTKKLSESKTVKNVSRGIIGKNK